MHQHSPFSRLLAVGLAAFFKVLYHQMAWAYDWVAAIVSIGRWNDWVLSVTPDLPGPRVLEVGHGTGHLQIALCENGLTAFGLDYSRQMGRLAFRNMRKRTCLALLVNGLAQQLPYAAESFDQVVSTFPSPYIFQQKTFEEIYRVLIPGGTLIVLPEARITGSSPLDQVAAGAFHITGQAPGWDDRYLQPFLEAGFVTKIERRRFPSSEILVIIAAKQPVS